MSSLHGEEAEQHDAGDADAPPDPPGSRTDEATQAPDRHDESGDPENAERDPERGRARFRRRALPACPAKISTPARIAATPVREPGLSAICRRA